MSGVYTPKQRELLRTWQRGELKRITLLEGSVSSGKTWASLVLWAFLVATMPRDGLFLMCAKSLTTLKRNCLLLLQELVGEGNFSFSVPAKEGYLFGRRVLFEGASDVRAESKIRGLTLQAAYCDELTQFPEDFFAMLLSRLRVPGARLIATTNPDSPGHWLMERYIRRAGEIDLDDRRFTIDDNPTLDPEYVRSIKAEYTGVYYDRFILGRWVKARGLVYQGFDRDRHVLARLPGPPPGPEDDLYISVDYGTMNPFSAGLWLVRDGVAWRLREFYHSGRDTGRALTDGEYHKALEALAGGLPIRAVIVDPSAASFIAQLRREGRFAVRRAKNDVLDGIRITASLLQAGRLFFMDGCADTIREFGLYSFDDAAADDRVVKEHDHAMDDVRYFCATVLRREGR